MLFKLIDSFFSCFFFKCKQALLNHKSCDQILLNSEETIEDTCNDLGGLIRSGK